jgi:hypothetical protein
MKKIIVVVMVLVLALAGCAIKEGSWLEKWFTDTNAGARAITKGVVAEYLSRNPRHVNAVYDVANDSISYIDSTATFTVDELEAYIKKVAAPSIAKLTPLGQVGAQELIALLKQRLIEQLPKEGPQLPENTKLVAKTFMTWIRDVAEIYKNAQSTTKEEYLKNQVRLNRSDSVL